MELTKDKVSNLKSKTDWKTKKLGDVGEVKMCKRIFNYQTNSRGSIPFFKIGTFGKEADAFISRELYDSYRLRFSFPKEGEILISAAGTIGRTIIYKGEPAYFQDSNIVWIDNNEKLIINSLLYYVLQRVSYRTEGGTIQRLYNSILKSTEFYCPIDPKEQKAIATALSDVDALIQQLEKLIKKKKAIKQGAMQQLLMPPDKGGKRFKGFKGNWRKIQLGKFASINMGQSPLSKFYNQTGDGLPLVQGNADIKERKTIIRNYSSQITKIGNMGDIIMSVRAPVGAIARATFPCCLGRGVCSISYKNNFLYHLLIFMEKSWSSFSTGSTFDSINSKQLHDLEIMVPTDEIEQVAVANILDDMDSELEVLNNKRNKLLSIKNGMMQELLTGKTRLI